MHKQKKQIKIIFTILTIWWTLAILLIGLQLYIMSRNISLLLVSTLIVLGMLVFHYFLYKNLIKHKIIAKVVLYAYIVLHFIPLLLQLIGLITPGFDVIITALIGTVLLYLSRKI